MGFLGSSDTSTTVTETAPYAAAAPTLDSLIGSVQGAYDQSQQFTNEGIPDDFIANLSDQQREALSRLQRSDQLGQVGQQAGQLAGIGQAGAQTGLAGLQGIASGQDQIGVDQDIFNQFYNEDLINQQINSAGQDIRRNLQEGELLNIDRNFAGIGGAGNSRAGVAEGVAIRGAQDRLGQIGTSIRSDAFNNANQQALNTSAARQQARGGASQQLFGTGLNSAGNALGQQAGFGQQRIENSLQAGGVDQQQRQNEIQGILDRQTRGIQQPFGSLSAALGLISPVAQAFGTTTGETESSGNLLGDLVGIGQTASGFV